MGTNYYADTTIGKCDECGRSGQRVHLGKTSAGWPPLLRLRRQEGGDQWGRDLPQIKTYAEWVDFVKGGTERGSVTAIVDEYGKSYTPDELIARLTRIGIAATVEELPPPERILENGWRGYDGEFT